MNRIKRIIALVGALLLVAMYASTLVFAFIDHSASQGLLKASIAATILLPVLLYAYTLVYKLSKDSSITFEEVESDESNEDS